MAWQHGPETITHRLVSAAGEVRFLKLSRDRSYPVLEDEWARMVWARTYLSVPDVLEAGSDGDVDWLLTSALPGVDATNPGLKARPERLVPLLASALRAFHSAPVEPCPFDFRLEAALRHVGRRLADDEIIPERDFHPEFADFTAARAVELLEATCPETEDLVVCHGDYCLPNVIIDGETFTGFVDLGELGVADRWWDLAVATWSLTWNIGPGFEDLFLKEYGIAPDDSRARFYRLLYDLAS